MNNLLCCLFTPPVPDWMLNEHITVRLTEIFIQFQSARGLAPQGLQNIFIMRADPGIRYHPIFQVAY